MASCSPDAFRRVLQGAIAAIAVATLAIATALPSSAATARIVTRSSLPTAKQLIKEAQKSMSGQSSVRLTSTDASTKQKESVTEDVGKSSGLESIQFGSASANVRLTSQAAYISGNTDGLEKLIGLSSTSAKKVGDKWIVVTKGSTPFKNIVAGGTIGPLTKELFPSSTKSVSVKSDKLNGQSVFALKWTTTESGSNTKIDLALDIASRGASLPIELTATQGSFVSVTQFGSWGEHISVSVPTKTIAYTKVE
jgi:hypothetical protein